MPNVRSNPITLFFIAFLLIATAPTPSHSLSFSSFFLYRDLFSLAHSLFTGVANLRASRADIAGAARARAIAEKLERGLGFGFWRRVLWSAVWNWRDFSVTEVYGVVSDMNELLRGLSELTRLESVAERSVWVSRNYQNVLALFKSLSRKLLKAFGQSGVLREVVDTVQKEVVEGGLIRDCLELGSNDLKALIQVAKNLVLQFFPASNKDPEL
ncbi:hypothetical protein RIF29_40448 [Crotalaria pallida]|uniref:Uncharacterized protein n=1 Tax=Crotalaria pallida TaxID=3830 RepID=A0AAN9E3X3_CROPI